MARRRAGRPAPSGATGVGSAAAGEDASTETIARWTATAADDLERVDRFVAAAAADPAWSRAQVQLAARAGRVRVGGRPAKAGQRLKPGDVVELVWAAPGRPPIPSGAAPAPKVVHEDEHLLVIDKARGVVVHPAAGHAGDTLVDALLARYGALEPGPPATAGNANRPGIVHRLDKDTTGLLLVARTAAAGAALRRDIAARQVRREYLALVWGEPPERFIVDAPVGRAGDRVRMGVVDRGRPARTHAERIEVFRGRPSYSLVRLRLETGRTHQIRVHLAAVGHPVAGDRTYGRPDDDAAAGLRLAGQALHACRLSLRHPVDGRDLVFEAALPDDVAAALDHLRRRPTSS